MSRRLLSLFLVAIVLCSGIAVEAHAESNYIELLEYGTVNDSGSNMFQFTNTCTVELDVPMYTILRYIDVTFTASDNVAPTTVRVQYGSSYYSLTVKQVSSNIYRAYGSISGYFDAVYLQFNATGTQYYTIQSCKVSAVTSDTVAATASISLTGHDFFETAGTAQIIAIEPESSTDYAPYPYSYQTVIQVSDATDYDALYVYGSVNYGSINSIRCTYGNTIVPYTVNFIDVEADVSWGSASGLDYINSYGKYIYSIEIDLSGIDRKANQYCMVYINGDYVSVSGLEFNCQAVTGFVLFADTTNASWWSRITQFLTNLFNPDRSEAEDFRDQAGEQSDELDNMNQQMEEIERPSVDDLDVGVSDYVSDADVAVVNTYFSPITQHTLVVTMVMISLTVALVAYILFGKR